MKDSEIESTVVPNQTKAGNAPVSVVRLGRLTPTLLADVRLSAKLRLVRITHKVDYGVRAVVCLARAESAAPGVPVKGEVVATSESIPPMFLNDILRGLRSGGLLRSQRGAEGGWTLARDPGDITVADVIRVLEGPLASVRGIRPHDLASDGVAEPFVSLWVAVRASLRSVLERVTVADLAQGRLPDDVAALLDAPGAWATR